ncbi:organoarsenical effux MFS transporter ArsJ [Thiomicrospira cyclica]|uniref:Major facilitator superfamily MFS_1 n=1 Tax=Thiomicrospira cyclica (strain DSM 14477 / JCM 11371 / ALM1) TaxID=717773 RepID=F6DAB9_THICA|nr:organoarsenical effux MFS transporter ArsJ [Thiomicrospira cyclica]AEG31085.1 major facilitator superfamily MFS_1 [Thiomicrospira cyclica ALM1]
MSPLQQYGLVTGNYWAFTITDGALRMLVVLYFWQLGYSPLEIALLFLFYEFFGIVTNLVGGWLGARWGLNVTMNIGLALQVGALLMLTVPAEWLGVVYVMIAQALSGIAKDLNKMSAKSAIKNLASDQSGQLYRWVTLLTGSKNALKGVGFFVGALLLAWVGFAVAMWIMASVLTVFLVISMLLLDGRLGKAKNKPKFDEMFAKNPQLNWLSGARFFLFGARDVWFVVALPVFLVSVLEWSHTYVGAYLALWVIGYGIVQALSPKLTGWKSGKNPSAGTARLLALSLAGVPLVMALLLDWAPQTVIVVGLLIFGVLFALNSAVHSYLIVSIASHDGTSKDVGFYYMANAAGRLVGTLLSGYVYQVAGMEACLAISALFVLIAGLVVIKMDVKKPDVNKPA